MSDLGLLLGKISGKLINAANVDRKLRCASCKKITEHAALSYSKIIGKDASVWANISTISCDIMQVYLTLFQGNHYACIECSRIQFEGGIFSNHYNQLSPTYLDY